MNLIAYQPTGKGISQIYVLTGRLRLGIVLVRAQLKAIALFYLGLAFGMYFSIHNTVLW